MRHHGAYDPPEYAGSGQPTRRAAQRLRELPARVSPLRAAKHALAAALQTEHGLSGRRERRWWTTGLDLSLCGWLNRKPGPIGTLHLQVI